MLKKKNDIWEDWKSSQETTQKQQKQQDSQNIQENDISVNATHSSEQNKPLGVDAEQEQ